MIGVDRLVSKQQINLKIDELLRRYNTRDPFLIAEAKGIVVITEALGDIYGYYHKVSRIPFILTKDFHTQIKSSPVFMNWGMLYFIQTKIHLNYPSCLFVLKSV